MPSLERAVDCLEKGDWNAAHEIVQGGESRLACWAHGIVHLMEGDLDNAAYWYRRAGRERPEPLAVTAEIAALKAEAGRGAS